MRAHEATPAAVGGERKRRMLPGMFFTAIQAFSRSISAMGGRIAPRTSHGPFPHSGKKHFRPEQIHRVC